MANLVVSDGAPVVDTITIYQGSTFQQAWEYAEDVDGSGALPPAPNWPSEWIARLEIRSGFTKPILCRFHTSDDPTADGVIELGVSADGLAGSIVIKLDADASSAMTWKGGIWDLELVHVPTNRVIRVLEGKAALRQEVTILG